MGYLNIDSGKTILMDVFNTIVMRSIPDEMVKLLWAEKVVEKYKLTLTPRNLYEERVSLERYSSALSQVKNHSRQCDITWVLKAIWKKYLKDSSLQEFLHISRQIEMNIEIENDSINQEWLKWIDGQNIEGIILVSDYYYGADYLKELLLSMNAPITHIRSIYVSCDYHKTKKEGTLYNTVLKTEHLDPNTCLMIGDSRNSDYINAKNNGLDAVLVKNEKAKWPYCKPKDTQKYISKHFDDSEFQRTTFLFYEFICNLHENLKKKGLSNVLFFSREGEFLIRLFQAYQDIIGDHSIKAHYFCVSRQATYLPSLGDYRDVDLDKYKAENGKISVEHLTYDLSIQEQRDWKSIFPSGYISTEDYLNSIDFRTVIDCEIKAQKDYFTSYIKSFGIDISKPFAIVDIGYLGKAQNHIYSIFNETAKINGYYLFLMKSHYKVDENNKKFGLIFDEYAGDSQNCYCMNKGILEDILLASHGSTRKYVKTEEDVKPVFYNVPIESETFGKYIKPIQERIFNNFVMLSSVYHSTRSKNGDYKKYHQSMYSKFIYNPTVEEMNIYCKIPHVQNYGKHTIEYPARRKENQNVFETFNDFVKIFTTKGEIIRQQNARWLPLAFYILHLNWINSFLYTFSPVTVAITDKDFKRRHKNL